MVGSSDFRLCAQQKHKPPLSPHYRGVGQEYWQSLFPFEEQGWRSGESTRFPPMWPGFKSRRRRHMSVEFVVGSLPCSERYFSGYSGFPLSSKTNISKFQFDQESGRRRTTLWMCYLQIVIFYFIIIYLFIISPAPHGLNRTKLTKGK